MKYLYLLITGLIISTSSFAGADDALPDEYLRKHIVGAWKIHIKKDNTEINAIDKFFPNGKVEQKGIIKTPHREVSVEMKSSWQIEHGFLIWTLESISPSGMRPVGSITKNRILSMSDNEFKYKSTGSRDVRTYQRVNTGANKIESTNVKARPAHARK